MIPLRGQVFSPVTSRLAGTSLFCGVVYSALRYCLWIGIAALIWTTWTTSPAQAATFSWIDSNSGAFNSPSRWSPDGGPPDTVGLDSAIFGQAGAFSVTGGGATSIISFNAGNITLNGNFSTDQQALGPSCVFIGGATVNLAAGSTFSSGKEVVMNTTLGGSSGNATLNVNAGTAFSIPYNIFPSLVVGNTSGASATVNVSGAGAVLNSAGEIDLSRLGPSTLSITGGGLVKSTSVPLSATPGMVIGENLSAQGTLTVDGVDAAMHPSTLQNSGQMNVGASGNGQFEITNGGVIGTGGDPNNPAMIIGDFATGTGTGYVHLNGSLTATGELVVGSQGTGSLTIETGGTVTATSNGSSGGVENPSLLLGHFANSNGSCTVQDGGVLTTTGQIDIGGGGDGTLTINNNGTVTSNPQLTTAAVFMANAAGTHGTVTMNGGTWNINGDLFLGGLGHGIVTVNSGATLDMSAATGSITIGASDGGLGELFLNGGQLLRPTSGNRAIVVGLGGRGRMEIHGGSQVADSVMRVAQEASTATDPSELIVEGHGPMPASTPSSLTLTSELSVGIDGNGSLTVQNGGQVSVTGASSTFTAGSGKTGDGEIQVTGTGSKLTAAGPAVLGQLGIGNAAVDTNGQIQTGAVTVAQFANSSGSMDMESGGSWTANGDLIVGDHGTAYIYLRQDGTLTLPGAANKIVVGNSADGIGTFSIFGNGHLSAANDLVIGQQGIGAFNLNDGAAYSSKGSMTLGIAAGSSGNINLFSSMAGTSSCQIDGDLLVGGAGAGNVGVFGGSTFTVTGALNAANQIGSTAGVTVDGAGSTLQVATALNIGVADQATLTIQNGGKVSITGAASTLTISGGTAGASSVTLTDNSQLLATPAAATVGGAGEATLQLFDTSIAHLGSLVVGGQGLGHLTVGGSAQLTVVATLTAGTAVTGDGEIHVTGAAATLTATGQTILGDSGAGNASVDTGGHISTGTLTLAHLAGSQGSINVESGGTWTVNGNLIVGDHSTAFVYLRKDGTLTLPGATNKIILGNSADGSGNFNIFGNGQLNVANDMVIGQLGAGSLNLTDGGLYHSKGSMTLGATAGSAGAINLNSSMAGNSSAQINGDLIVGGAGNGNIGVSDGSTVTVTGALSAAQLGGSTARMIVDGTGVLSATQIHLGGTSAAAGGVASLSLTNGGSVFASQKLNLWDGGSIDVAAGAATIGNVSPSAAVGSLRVNQNGALSGIGQITGNVLNDAGTAAPGNSPGVLTILGNFTQNLAGTLQIEIGGTTPASAYDQLHASGAVALNGTLQVSLVNNFHPARLNKFDILDWGSESGTFSSLQLPKLTGSLGWNASNLYSTGTLSVIDLSLLPGDMNLDGHITQADFPLLELALVNRAGYEALVGTNDATLNIVGDANESGIVDNSDLQGLLYELIHGTSFLAGNAPPLGGEVIASGSGTAAVPEPASLILAACGMGALIVFRKRLTTAR